MKSKEKNVYIRFYNANNLGDDLFVKIITSRYVNSFETLKFRENVSIRRIDNLKLIGFAFLNKAAGFVERKHKRSNSMLFRQARKNDVLVYIGGSVFIESTPLSYWKRELGLYENLHIPYYILGSNFGPYGSPEFLEIVSKIIASAQDVCFRDQASYDLFEKAPSVRVATDIAFMLDTKDYAYTTQGKTVVFSVIDAYKKFDEKTATKYEQEIINLASQFVNNGYRVTLMSFCKFEGDEEAINRILKNMDDDLRQKVDVYRYAGDLGEALTVLAKSEIIVASRFHASILGLVFGKKVLPMAYSNKTTDILNDIGFKGPVIDIRKIDKFDGRTFDINSLKLNDISKQKKLAEKQFQELDKVLTRRK